MTRPELRVHQQYMHSPGQRIPVQRVEKCSAQSSTFVDMSEKVITQPGKSAACETKTMRKNELYFCTYGVHTLLKDPTPVSSAHVPSHPPTN